MNYEIKYKCGILDERVANMKLLIISKIIVKIFLSKMP